MLETSPLVEAYRRRTPGSAALAARALWQGDLLLAEQFSDEAARSLADHRSRELAFGVATSQRFFLRRFQGRLAELEPQLDGVLRDTGAFVTGAGFTLADVVLGLATQRWFMTPMVRPDLPALAAYYDRLDTRPGFCAHGRNGIP